MRKAPLLLFLFIFLFSLGPAVSTSSPRVGVLYTGDPYPGVTPYVFMKSEPFLRVTPIAASRDYLGSIISPEQIRRTIRLYMPRTYESLIGKYDAIILSDANVLSFSASHLQWFKRAVEERGVGLLMVGGHESFGTHGGHPDWGQTPVGDVQPVETVFGKIGTGKVTILAGDNPFIRSLPWRPDLRFLRTYSSNIVKARPGSETLALDKINAGNYIGWNNPFFSTWKSGKGRTFAFTGDWQYGWGVEFIKWEYTPDFATNLMLYLANRSVPQDLELVHTIRTRMATLSYRRLILGSLVDFVDRLGGNTKRLLVAARNVDEETQIASDLYLDQQFDAALEAVDHAIDLMNNAESVAEKAKKGALFWIYATEWMVVTGTTLLCGFVLWTLMIRQRLYVEAATTRFSG